MNKIPLILFVLTSLLGYSQQLSLIDVYCEEDSTSHIVIDPEALYVERWDTLAQPIFWKSIMNLSGDTCIINDASSREVLGYVEKKEWHKQSEEEKKAFKDSVRLAYCLDFDTKIYITSGKKDFYLIEEVIPSISRAIDVFKENNVDPWFAQAILLIESPGKLKYSRTGAFGSFQLMKSVARSLGLTVNKTIDERKDFDKSALAASQLLKTICIPHARRILCDKDIDPVGDELWFKLLVLHIYHAGAKNVEGLLSQLDEPIEGMELIQWMWSNEWGNFKNASQNYSQVAIAAMLCLQDIVLQDCDFIFPCEEQFNSF